MLFRLRRSNDELRNHDTISLGLGNLLQVGKTAALLPALLGRSATARAIHARKRLGKIFVRIRTERNIHLYRKRQDDGGNSKQNAKANKPANSLSKNCAIPKHHDFTGHQPAS